MDHLSSPFAKSPNSFEETGSGENGFLVDLLTTFADDLNRQLEV